ncbi:hypothetical protein XF24_00629 [candidate division SR1 bacterium Aalborg_AAW-1]|nr:hypothetical protein XF24_00629 [candidate division SR1 bacterium Aalborg_AAW-1]
MSIQTSINKFLEGNAKNKGRKPNERYASFDFCYNYFYKFYKEQRLHELANKENIEMSCLQLGFYLASRGMLRGSSFLLEKSVKHYQKLIIAISEMSPILWEIDVDQYNEENIKILLECKQNIIESLGVEYNPSDTLVTKIMLGVFANIPAYDQYFKKSLKVNRVNKESLLKIKNFYENNKNIFDNISLYTFDFTTSKQSQLLYSKAKVIDMYGFISGQ